MWEEQDFGVDIVHGWFTVGCDFYIKHLFCESFECLPSMYNLYICNTVCG